jgi:hypothetical protein
MCARGAREGPAPGGDISVVVSIGRRRNLRAWVLVSCLELSCTFSYCHQQVDVLTYLALPHYQHGEGLSDGALGI